MPLISSTTATEEQVSALIAEMEAHPDYAFRGGYGTLIDRDKAISGLNYYCESRRQWISIEIDRPYCYRSDTESRENIKVRLYVDQVE
jgi:hypothetical protein